MTSAWDPPPNIPSVSPVTEGRNAPTPAGLAHPTDPGDAPRLRAVDAQPVTACPTTSAPWGRPGHGHVPRLGFGGDRVPTSAVGRRCAWHGDRPRRAPPRLEALGGRRIGGLVARRHEHAADGPDAALLRRLRRVRGLVGERAALVGIYVALEGAALRVGVRRVGARALLLVPPGPDARSGRRVAQRRGAATGAAGGRRLVHRRAGSHVRGRQGGPRRSPGAGGRRGLARQRHGPGRLGPRRQRDLERPRRVHRLFLLGVTLREQVLLSPGGLRRGHRRGARRGRRLPRAGHGEPRDRAGRRLRGPAGGVAAGVAVALRLQHWRGRVRRPRHAPRRPRPPAAGDQPGRLAVGGVRLGDDVVLAVGAPLSSRPAWWR